MNGEEGEGKSRTICGILKGERKSELLSGPTKSLHCSQTGTGSDITKDGKETIKNKSPTARVTLDKKMGEKERTC